MLSQLQAYAIEDWATSRFFTTLESRDELYYFAMGDISFRPDSFILQMREGFSKEPVHQWSRAKWLLLQSGHWNLSSHIPLSAYIALTARSLFVVIPLAEKRNLPSMWIEHMTSRSSVWRSPALMFELSYNGGTCWQRGRWCRFILVCISHFRSYVDFPFSGSIQQIFQTMAISYRRTNDFVVDWVCLYVLVWNRKSWA